MKKLLGVFLAILILPVCAQAASITFTSDGTIKDGDIWNAVSIYDTLPNHTVVNMTGGTIADGGIYVCNAATLNMSGGGVWGGGLNALDQSTINISGGYASGASVGENAIINISDNANVHGINSYGTLNVYGGTIGQLYSWEYSTVNIYDGAIGSLVPQDSSTLNLHGGLITYLIAGSTTNIFGYDLTKTNTGGTYGYGQVTGFWRDGSSFIIELRGPGTYINLIPEPTTLLLLCSGIFLLRKSHYKY